MSGVAHPRASVVQWSTELPVAGSSFTYVMASLGQLPAFLVTSNMVSLQPTCCVVRVQRRGDRACSGG